MSSQEEQLAVNQSKTWTSISRLQKSVRIVCQLMTTIIEHTPELQSPETNRLIQQAITLTSAYLRPTNK